MTYYVQSIGVFAFSTKIQGGGGVAYQRGLITPFSRALLKRTGTSSQKTIGAGVETVLIVIKPKLVFQNKLCVSNLLFDEISLATDGTKVVRFKVYKNALPGSGSVTDYPNYIDNGATSILSYDTTSISQSGGLLIFEYVLGKVDSAVFDLAVKNVTAVESLNIVITAISTGASDVAVGVSLLED